MALSHESPEALKETLAAEKPSGWPLYVYAPSEEAERMANLHKALGRAVLVEVDEKNNHIGYSTFYPVPDPRPGTWGIEQERNVSILFEAP